MKKIYLLLAMTLLFSMISCRPTVRINGQTYKTLTKDEEQELISIARFSLKNSPKVVSKMELMYIQKTEPRFLINYTGDCFGEAKIIWETNDRIITMVFFDKFFSNSMGSMLKAERTKFELEDQTKHKILKDVKLDINNISLPPKK